MALPKKKTSKARSRRRFSQYETKRTEKLVRVANTLKQIDRPFIFDKKANPKVKASKNQVNPTEVKETKKDKLNIEKVEKIEIKETKKTKEVKDVKQETPATETSVETKDVAKKEEKGQWFKNLFNTKKNEGGSQVKDLSQKGQKKVFRRKAM